MHHTSLAARSTRQLSQQHASASRSSGKPTTRSACQPRASAQHQQQQQRPSTLAASSRRSLLLGGGTAAAAGLLLLLPGARQASADTASDLQRQLPGLGYQQQQPAQLPKPYQRTMRRLARALQDSIEAEAAGAKEFEVGGRCGCVGGRLV
jgi:hypothetical protein